MNRLKIWYSDDPKETGRMTLILDGKEVEFRPLRCTERLRTADVWFDYQERKWKPTQRIGKLAGEFPVYYRRTDAQ